MVNLQNLKGVLTLPIGIAYDWDLQKAKALMLEGAAVIKRVLTDPEPARRLVGPEIMPLTWNSGCGSTTPDKGMGPVKSDLL